MKNKLLADILWNLYWRSYNDGGKDEDLEDMISALGKEDESVSKYKPCPFCGSTEIHTYEPMIYEPENDASVKCENPLCGAEVRGLTLKHAIAKWNRRVNE